MNIKKVRTKRPRQIVRAPCSGEPFLIFFKSLGKGLKQSRARTATGILLLL